ncbi:MAG: DinB family protein [Ferruginibacter sp.]|nr:DinB family protein [Ferruginibacter sp.]
MQINKEQLITELLSLTEQATIAVKEFKNLDINKLNFKKTPEQWSILECIEHLNLYGDFYLPEIQKQLLDTKYKEDSSVFKPGIIGDYFVGLMKTKNGKIKKMKSPKDKNPANSILHITTLDRFLKQEQLLQSLLKQALTADLTKIKTAISLSKFIKLRLGDTLRFYVYHIERHIKQAEKIIA